MYLFSCAIRSTCFQLLKINKKSFLIKLIFLCIVLERERNDNNAALFNIEHMQLTKEHKDVQMSFNIYKYFAWY